jgi:putative peptide zinc metalloprotease protein
MRESAFEDPPWLIDRSGEGYVQVTELLYRIAEVLDGEHSFDQIAAHVAEATGRPVTADNVRQLVESQFARKGLVAFADGRVAHAVGSRSLLQLSMRVRAFSGQRIDPVVRILQWLYWPPVLAVSVCASLAVEVWLYVVHGVAGGVHDALYAPGLLLVILFATIVSAGFHELGHAAALRYGGGFPRSMGAGLYLVYPAFYTDVSDNYRLGRWARVRTDLGGFYFNLLFALAVTGLYALTRQEVLLLVLPLLNLEMLRQLVPIMRLDGYWTLADITGVPDFISHIGAFVRSVLPWRSEKAQAHDRRLPQLKRWAGVVFALYILIAIPLIGLQLTIMLRGVPRVLATAWDSASREFGVIAQTQASGDTLGTFLGLLHLVALLLPALAVGVGLTRFVKRTSAFVWRWSSQSSLRRVGAGVATLGVLAFLAYAWLPSRQAGSPTTISGQAEYVPIAANERGSVGDLVTGAVATTAPRPSAPGPASTTAAPTVEPATATPEPGTPTPEPTPPTPAVPATSPALAIPSPSAAVLTQPSPPRTTPVTTVSPVPRAPTQTQTQTQTQTPTRASTPTPTSTSTSTSTSTPRG